MVSCDVKLFVVNQIKTYKTHWHGPFKVKVSEENTKKPSCLTLSSWLSFQFCREKMFMYTKYAHK